MAEGTLPIELVWIGVEPPVRLALRVPEGTTVAQALVLSGIAATVAASGRVPAGQGPLEGLSVAVHGRAAAPQDRLHEHDRIELLPPLTVDPKVARQRRADHRRRLAGERRWTPDRERTVPRGA
jgi:uncharacterized protein